MRSSKKRLRWCERCSAATQKTSVRSRSSPVGSVPKALSPRTEKSTGTAPWSGGCCAPLRFGCARSLKTTRLEQRARGQLHGASARTKRVAYPMTQPRAFEDWITIAVPAIVSEEIFALTADRLEDNRRFASRNTKEPSLLMGLVACQSCGYAYDRTSTWTKKRKLYYYRCLGSDDYRYEHGRICENKPVRADYLDELVWGQVTALLADPALVQAELYGRLAELRHADPATVERARTELELARATKAIERLVAADQRGPAHSRRAACRHARPARQGNQSGRRGSCRSMRSCSTVRPTLRWPRTSRPSSRGCATRPRWPALKTDRRWYAVSSRRSWSGLSASLSVLDPAHRPFRHGGYRLRLRSHR